MAGIANTFQSDLLKLIFQNTGIANLGDVAGVSGSAAAGNLYISLHTADPTNAGNQTSNEATYIGYARVAVVRTTAGWTISGSSPTQASNTAAIIFGMCTSGSNTITHAAVGRDSSGVGEILFVGALSSPLAVSGNITPLFNIGSLVCTLD